MDDTDERAAMDSSPADTEPSDIGGQTADVATAGMGEEMTRCAQCPGDGCQETYEYIERLGGCLPRRDEHLNIDAWFGDRRYTLESVRILRALGWWQAI